MGLFKKQTLKEKRVYYEEKLKPGYKSTYTDRDTGEIVTKPISDFKRGEALGYLKAQSETMRIKASKEYHEANGYYPDKNTLKDYMKSYSDKKNKVESKSKRGNYKK